MKRWFACLTMLIVLLGATVPAWADGPEMPGAFPVPFDLPICFSNFNMISVPQMKRTHQEYTTGDMIADSYVYEAKKAGIEDIDVAIVALGSIRRSVKWGPLTVADAIEICYADDTEEGREGYPLVCVYLTGSELKYLTELDASLGPKYPELKLSYSGLNMRFNTKRIPLDRVTSVGLSRSNGMIELLENGMLYKMCCNLYAVQQLDRLNALTKGFMTITPRDANGDPLDSFEDCILRAEDGTEIKEWMALADYWMSFRIGSSGLPEIPPLYSEPQSRKVKYEEGGISRIDNPGRVTLAAIGVAVLALILLIAVVDLIRSSVARRAYRKAAARKEKA
ncbi:MAG: 5'-nucleotidase C-terminal domain-containing protein [Firmicutes bacterium]|nr:5'-nucleotidase C-terminal domain-containing protein [Bacillota bacterium]